MQEVVKADVGCELRYSPTLMFIPRHMNRTANRIAFGVSVEIVDIRYSACGSFNCVISGIE